MTKAGSIKSAAEALPPRAVRAIYFLGPWHPWPL
jgi:hypothetical protein